MNKTTIQHNRHSQKYVDQNKVKFAIKTEQLSRLVMSLTSLLK